MRRDKIVNKYANLSFGVNVQFDGTVTVGAFLHEPLRSRTEACEATAMWKSRGKVLQGDVERPNARRLMELEVGGEVVGRVQIMQAFVCVAKILGFETWSPVKRK